VMAYLALYRRFRPQGFEGLIGQDHVVKILKNQIKTDKIGHAYLFCGARGTGKTTVAKFFARAINCLHPIDGSPCGECENCVGLKDPSNMDVLEMDAASNNGVEDVREMREKIQYPPVVGRYKVYIVDEVHMLSPAAFNALLKTLEEPPAHAVFIFATTEVHKIPQTILSRCMRFDFKLISQPELKKLVSGVFDKIGKEYEDAAVDLIARAGEGSARDCLSIADMCSSYSVGKLTYGDVLEVLGATDVGKVLGLAENLIDGDTGAALKAVDELASLGKNMGVLASDLAATLRDLIVCRTAKDPNSILLLPDDRFKRYAAVADRTDGNRLLRLIDIFTSLDNAFRYSTHPRIVLETAVVRACRPECDYDIDALLSRMTKVEELLKRGSFELAKTEKVPENAKESTISEKGYDAPPAEEAEKREEKREEKTIEEKEETDAEFESLINSMPPEDGSSDLVARAITGAPTPAEKEILPPAKVWGSVLKTLRNNGNAVLWTICQDVTARVKDGTLVISTSGEGEYAMLSRETHLKTLEDAARKFGDYKVEIVKKTAEPDDYDDFVTDVKEIERTFGEDMVKIIKND
ncbi:MAG: DNA polymerase III subunit gamma/tau, partial [Clostridia bacterium]|nr:DNA polymerase III subunit gamma/tau [Clostridia bacterium]